MALSDCEKCWDTPCTCGWDYRNYTIQRLEEMRDIFNNIIKYKEDHPDANFSRIFSHETPDDKMFMKFMHNSELDVGHRSKKTE